ncbi:cytochrome P450 [Thozetella sp. PMI_491]|nr:cytochrome P450 [Thozetella sp. PMI_491]
MTSLADLSQHGLLSTFMEANNSTSMAALLWFQDRALALNKSPTVNQVKQYLPDLDCETCRFSFISFLSLDRAVWIPIVLLSLLFVPYMSSTLQFRKLRAANTNVIPVAPYCIPGIFHTISMLLSPGEFVSGLVERYGKDRPVMIKAGVHSFSIFSKPEHIQAVLQSSKRLSAKVSTMFALRFLLALPKEVIPFYLADDSGMAATPREGSKTAQEDRIHFLQARTAQKFLSAPHLSGLIERYRTVLENNLDKLDISYEWTDMDDLYWFLQKLVTQSSTEAIMGSKILELNPRLVEDFWLFQSYTRHFLHFFPRWLIPKAYEARERLLAGIKRWHTYAHQHSDCTQVAPTDPDWDPHLGTKFVKARQFRYLQMKPMTAEARACEDLGLIFALNANVLPCTFWFVFEALRNPSLHSRLLQEVERSACQEDGHIDQRTLVSQPLVQSTYAEVLRLYVPIFLNRVAEYDDVDIGGYTIPKGTYTMVYSRTSALNHEAWMSAGRQLKRPLEEFDADRFLVDPEPGTTEGFTAPQEKRFSMDGLAGLWLPYGGGDRICPGRHFAKAEILVTYAVLFTKFDVEITAPNPAAEEPDLGHAPFGSLPPKSKLSFRIRRKTREREAG